MKKKVFFKFNGFIVLVLLSLCMASCKIGSDPFGAVESGDFIYATDGFRGDDEGWISIIGLSEQGKQKEVLVFPNMIDGHPVIQYGAQFVLKGSEPIEIENAKKVYFCNLFNDYDYVRTTFRYNRNVEIFIGGSGTKQQNDFSEYMDKYVVHYVDGYLYKKYIKFYYKDFKLKTSTIAYYYEEESCYFVDYVVNEKVSVIPPEPYKEGYTFDGWYKDLEYTEKWDFANDIVVPIPKEKEFEGDFDYEPVKLYAKWKEK